MNGWIALAVFFAIGLAGLALKSNLLFFSAPIVATAVSIAIRAWNARRTTRR